MVYIYEQKYPISSSQHRPPVEPDKVIPRVRQRLRLLVLADTADKRVAEVWDQMKGLGLVEGLHVFF